MKFNIALLQILPDGTNQNKNLEKGLEFCKKAKRLGADLVLFPEMWNIGCEKCPFSDEEKKKWEGLAIDQLSEFFQSYVKIAKVLEINIALTYLEKYLPKPRNTASIIDKNGVVVLNYSKVFICNFGLDELSKDNPDYSEVGLDYNCIAGTGFEVCALQGKEGEVKMGAMICADREFPEAATQLMLKGAELIVVPNSCEWKPILTDVLKVRAFDNQIGIAMANYPAPKNNGNSRAYHTVAWDKQGNSQNTLVTEAGQEEGVFISTFDLDQIREFRKMESWRLDYRRKWYK